MFRPNRLLAALVLALSVTGCAGLPGAGLTNAPAVTAEDASVKVTIGSGYSTQAFENIALTLRLELPYAMDPSKRVQVLNVQNGVPTEFKNLPTGYGTLTAIATNTTTKVVIDKQSQPVQLRPGYQAQAYFNLVVGGSSAMDLNVYFDSAHLDWGMVKENDGLDDAFRDLRVPNGPFNFVWKKDGKALPVVYQTADNGGLRRRIGDGPEEWMGYWEWFRIPAHAVRVDSSPMGPYSKVRHYQWQNVYMIDGGQTELIIDRWISPYEGLIKETVSKPSAEGPLEVATLVREGL